MANVKFYRLGLNGGVSNASYLEYTNTTDGRIVFAQVKGENASDPLEHYIWANGIEYHVLNDKILEGTFGYNFVGFYTAIVFVIGSYFARYFSADLPSLPLIESPHPEILMDICEGIVISRHLQDFRNEDYYYCVLADLLRTPELINKMTYSNLPLFYQREKIIT